jgi:Uma2 family endonuclease
MRVKVRPSGLYTYADVVIVCGQPQFEQPGETLINPTVLVEVLSDSSEAYDRGKKSEQYRSLSTLTDYLLIAQDRVLVEHHSRQPSERWLTRQSEAPSVVGFAIPSTYSWNCETDH